MKEKTRKEVQEAINDWYNISNVAFNQKYPGITSVREGVGFIKALHWVLGRTYEE